MARGQDRNAGLARHDGAGMPNRPAGHLALLGLALDPPAPRAVRCFLLIRRLRERVAGYWSP
jgi:hypothetical protein